MLNAHKIKVIMRKFMQVLVPIAYRGKLTS